ncbi:MAG TPA: cytochrome c oxidase subunit I, partial [Verrucomicrobiae bacterium]|nr:cytochrome c oxidase subunit I [Verrucomicrobiae bacterium]
PPEFQFYNIMSSLGASILGVGYLLPIIYFIWSLKHGKKAPANPWKATGLEWQTTSPPPKHNFHEIPMVTEPPYQYSPEAAEKEFNESKS